MISYKKKNGQHRPREGALAPPTRSAPVNKVIKLRHVYSGKSLQIIGK